MLIVEGDTENGRSRVLADSRERQELFALTWKFAAMFGDHLLGGALQIARAAVVAEARPQAQHFFLRSRSKGNNAGKTGEKFFVVGDHRRHARLLQHDFRDPNAVRITILAPGQIALIIAKPIQERFAKLFQCNAVQ